METKIQKTLKLWFPTAFADKTLNGSDSDYEILQQFARYTLKLIQENNKNEKEPFKIMNVLYQNGSLHDKNAIENEFFRILTMAESPGTLKLHLQLMPDNLKPVYLKTLLEN